MFSDLLLTLLFVIKDIKNDRSIKNSSEADHVEHQSSTLFTCIDKFISQMYPAVYSDNSIILKLSQKVLYILCKYVSFTSIFSNM